MGVLFPKQIPYETHGDEGAGNGGYYDDSGDWVPGTPKTGKTFTGGVQPTTGNDIATILPGRENVGLVKVYSNIELPVSEEDGDEAGAVITWSGRKWELIQEMNRNAGVINHYKYIAQLKGVVT